MSAWTPFSVYGEKEAAEAIGDRRDRAVSRKRRIVKLLSLWNVVAREKERKRWWSATELQEGR